MTHIQASGIIKELSPFYKISPEEVTRKTGIEIESEAAPGGPAPPGGPTSVMPEVAELYRPFIQPAG